MTFPPLVVFVGAGGVGKTTLAAASGLLSARSGNDTLVMTFDPSHRLRQALCIDAARRGAEVPVPIEAPARLDASLLDARDTFDRLVARYSPDGATRERIYGNRFYDRLSGALSGILEYMAVERLFEVRESGRYRRVILDTPPTRQALDFLAAPRRIVDFLESGAIRLALRPWFDERGRFRALARLPLLGRRVEGLLDEVVGLDLLRDMAEFFQAFAPLFAGFRARAAAVETLLRSPETAFVLISGPGAERIAETLFFARKLVESGCHLAGILVNRVHPAPPPGTTAPALFDFLARRDAAGLSELAARLGGQVPLWALALLPEEPGQLGSLERVGAALLQLGPPFRPAA